MFNLITSLLRLIDISFDDEVHAFSFLSKKLVRAMKTISYSCGSCILILSVDIMAKIKEKSVGRGNNRVGFKF